MNKKILLYLIPILTLLLVSNCYSEDITDYNHESRKDKKVEENTNLTRLPGQDYVNTQENKRSFPYIPIQENPNIDKSMIIQGDSSIDPYMLIDPPGKIAIEPSKIATPPPDSK
jgi:hypothetical protein